MNKTTPFCKLIITYILIMILGMIFSQFFTIVDRHTTIWIVNIIGFSIFLFFSIYHSKSISKFGIFISFFYLLISIITLIFHRDHLVDDTKSFGLNINIIAVMLNISFIYFNIDNKMNENDLIIINRLILIIGVLSSIYNLLLGGFSISKMINANNIYTVATCSFFDNKNTFGVFSFFSIIAGIYLLFKDKYKVLIILLLFLQVFTLIISFSRSSLLIFVIFISILLILLIANRKKLSYIELTVVKVSGLLFLLLLITVGCMFILNDNFHEFVDRTIIRSDFGDAGRSNIWEQGLTLIDLGSVDLLFGIGWSDLNSYGNSYLHNIYIELFVVGGIFKLLIYLYLFIYAFVNLRKKKKYGLISYIGISCLFSYIIFGMFESQIIFELGITPFLFMLYIFIMPNSIILNGDDYEK